MFQYNNAVYGGNLMSFTIFIFGTSLFFTGIVVGFAYGLHWILKKYHRDRKMFNELLRKYGGKYA